MIAVPVAGTMPSRKASSTNACVSSGLSAFVGDDAVELLVPPGLDEATPVFRRRPR